MRDKMWFKILLSIVLIVPVLVVGFFIVVITAFLGNGTIFIPLSLLSVLVVIVFLILAIFKLVKPKLLYSVTAAYFIIVALFIFGNVQYNMYINSIPTVSEQDVNLSEYKPFAVNSKAVKLNEESTLKIQGVLPVLDGATALYPLYSAFVQATYPQGEYDIYGSIVRCTKTIEAYQNLLNGSVDMIFTARPSAQQLADAQSRGVEFKLTPIGHEAFVFFVNAQNSIESLTTVQIQDIYSGEITNWKEVGGSNDSIRAFQRPENSGSQTMLQKLMEGKTLMKPLEKDVFQGMGEIIEATANYKNYKNAIGYSFRFFSTEMVKNNQIKLLKVDGVYPDPSSIASKRYPLVADIYAVTTTTTNPNVQPFINWILSPQGQVLVEKTGYSPL